MTPLTFHAVKTNYALQVEIYGRARVSENRFQIVEPVKLTIREVDINQSDLPGPMLTLATEIAQNLFDALSDAGFRHSTETQSAAQLGATERHLTDMRCLVEKAYSVNLNLMIGVSPQ